MVGNPFPWSTDESYTVGDKTYTVHPLAKLFPLIFGDEFECLVDDMRAHGLRRPILVTGETMIVDGRNRLRAAVQADIRPVFETLPPDANLFSVIVSENVLRRQMNKGQLAMVAALIRDECERLHIETDRLWLKRDRTSENDAMGKLHEIRLVLNSITGRDPTAINEKLRDASTNVASKEVGSSHGGS